MSSRPGNGGKGDLLGLVERSLDRGRDFGVVAALSLLVADDCGDLDRFARLVSRLCRSRPRCRPGPRPSRPGRPTSEPSAPRTAERANPDRGPRSLLPIPRGVAGENGRAATIQRLHGQHGHRGPIGGQNRQDRGTGPRALNPRATVQRRQSGRLRVALPRWKEIADVGENRMPRSIGRQRRQKLVGELADLAAAEPHGQGLAQRRARVTARAEAVIPAEHHQPRPRSNPLEKHLLQLRAKERAVDVAQDENVELVDRLLVGRGSQPASCRRCLSAVRTRSASFAPRRRTPDRGPWPGTDRPARRIRPASVPSMYSTRMPASATVETAER